MSPPLPSPRTPGSPRDTTSTQNPHVPRSKGPWCPLDPVPNLPRCRPLSLPHMTPLTLNFCSEKLWFRSVSHQNPSPVSPLLPSPTPVTLNFGSTQLWFCPVSYQNPSLNPVSCLLPSPHTHDPELWFHPVSHQNPFPTPVLPLFTSTPCPKPMMLNFGSVQLCFLLVSHQNPPHPVSPLLPSPHPCDPERQFQHIGYPLLLPEA